MGNSSTTFRPTVSQSIWIVLASVLIAISVFFRFWRLANIPGLNGDEAIYGADAIDLLHGKQIDWATPTGNVKNIFYYVPVILLHALFPPSIVLLRTTAVLCGIASVAVNYWLCRKIYGQRTAVLTSLLIAVLPEDIAQSRIGWDPCESVLIDLFVVYGSLTIARREQPPKWPIIGTVGACAAAFTIHPTNLFVDLLFPTALIIRWIPEIVAYFKTGNTRNKIVVAIVGVVAAVGAGAFLLQRQILMASKIRHGFSRGFAVEYASLFSGRSIYAYVAGYPRPLFTLDKFDVISLLPWILCLFFMFKAVTAKKEAGNADRLLAAGWLVSLLAFALIAAPTDLEPGNERFGLCFIVPGVWLFVRALENCAMKRRVAAWLPQVTTFVLSVALLMSFYNCYFRYILTTGGNSAESFRTAAKDPKLAAMDYVISQCPVDNSCYVVTHTWWTYQPARYFAMGHPNVHVPLVPKATRAELVSMLRAMKSGNLWTVDFVDEQSEIVKEFATQHVVWTFIEVPDYSGRPVVMIGHPVPATTQPSHDVEVTR